MRTSRTITLTVLAGLTLTACSLGSGCGQSNTPAPPAALAPARQHEPPDRTWYDEDGNPIPEEWKTDDQGNRVPAHGVPHDRYGRPWVHTGGIWSPILIPVGHAPYRAPTRPSSWLTGGSGYRTSNATTTYRAGTGTGSSSVVSHSSSSSAPSGSSVSRGGFGSTGLSSGSSSS